jgi:hypothetical protein
MNPGASPGAPAGGCGYVQAMVNQTPAYGIKRKKPKTTPRKKKKDDK